jgi:flagellar biosynthetic protein FlhB
MAEDQDKSQKTEEPTEKKLKDARKKGNLPVSREVGTFFSILMACLITAFFAPLVADRFGEIMVPLVGNADEIDVGLAQEDLGNLLTQLAIGVALALSAVFFAFIMGAVIAQIAQNALAVAPDRIKPKLERIDPIKGFGRLFGMSAVVEFLKGAAKVTVVGAVVAVILTTELRAIENSLHYDIASLPDLMRDLTARLLLAVLIATAAITVLDVIWRRFDWKRQLKMSKQEIKDEHKQSEGDPHVRAKLREIRRERSRKRMMQAVPSATVVVTNPTHFAVALKYDRHETPAPVCVAKGTDLVALKIREIAKENNVPIVENPPLARALHAAIEVDAIIPREHYEAVAEVITYIYRTDQRAVQA